MHFHVTLNSGWCSYITDSHQLQEHLEPQIVPAVSGHTSLVLSLQSSASLPAMDTERFVKGGEKSRSLSLIAMQFWYKVHTSTKKWWRAHKWQRNAESHRSVNSFHVSVAKGTVSHQYFLQTTMIWIPWPLVKNASVYSGSVEKLGITWQDLFSHWLLWTMGTPA